MPRAIMPPMRPNRPHGQPTRGKTAGNRLRRVDVYTVLAMPGLLRGGSPLAIDLGFGARPWTTLELADRWRRVNPELRVLGVEIDPDRVTEALPHAMPPSVDFVRGGFDLASVLGSERARVVRCLNVLRQYDETAVAGALASVATALEPGGAVIEGTSNPSGRIVAFDVYRAGGDVAPALRHDALVFATNFRTPTEPAEFRTIAPKRLIHRMFDETPARFFSDWERAWVAARRTGRWTGAGACSSAASSRYAPTWAEPVDAA